MAAGASFYDSNNKANAELYWAEMVANCLSTRAQFRYLDSGLVQNIEKKGTLASRHNKPEVYKRRLFIYASKSEEGKKFERNQQRYRLKQTPGQSLGFQGANLHSCAQPNGTNVDQKKYGCQNSKKQKFTFGKKIFDIFCLD